MGDTLPHSFWQLVHSSVAGTFACRQGQLLGGEGNAHWCATPAAAAHARRRCRWSCAAGGPPHAPRGRCCLATSQLTGRPGSQTTAPHQTAGGQGRQAGREGTHRGGSLSGIQLITVHYTVCSVQLSDCKHLAADSTNTAGTAGAPGIGTGSRRCRPSPAGRCRLRPRRGGPGVRGGALRWA